MNKPVISVKNLGKKFLLPDGEIQVLWQVSFELEEKECLCLLGYSGCGKTTLLRIIARLESFQTGEICILGQSHSSPTKDVLLLFQDFNQLFPWKTVLGNVLYSMKVTNPKEDKERLLIEAKNIIQSVGLSGFENSYPHQLSGGMKQRTAVARALAVKPKILLMDEPFAALDTVNRTNLQILTQKLCRQHGITMIFVTHDVEEAVLMGDRIAIMKSSPGRLGTIIENPYLLSQNSEDKLKTITFIHEYLEKSMIDQIENMTS